MTLQDSPGKYQQPDTCASYMFIVNQIYSVSAAGVREHFRIEA